jgi:hypothetical protein
MFSVKVTTGTPVQHHLWISYQTMLGQHQQISYMRFNNCNLGIRLIPEVESLKILGIKFKKPLNETSKVNFDTLAATTNFMCRRNSIRNLNFVQKVWLIKIKLWYVSQVIPPGNQQIGKIKRAVDDFIWAGHLYRIDRRQLCRLCLPKKWWPSLNRVQNESFVSQE